MKMAASEAQKRASAKYDKVNTKTMLLKFNLKTDADILAHLETVGNKQGFIKELIRASIHQNIVVNTNILVEGDFSEGEFVTVRVEGNVYERRVVNGEITIRRKQYKKEDFN